MPSGTTRTRSNTAWGKTSSGAKRPGWSSARSAWVMTPRTFAPGFHVSPRAHGLPPRRRSGGLSTGDARRDRECFGGTLIGRRTPCTGASLVLPLASGCRGKLPHPPYVPHPTSALREVALPSPPAPVELVPERPSEDAVWKPSPGRAPATDGAYPRQRIAPRVAGVTGAVRASCCFRAPAAPIPGPSPAGRGKGVWSHRRRGCCRGRDVAASGARNNSLTGG